MNKPDSMKKAKVLPGFAVAGLTLTLLSGCGGGDQAMENCLIFQEGRGAGNPRVRCLEILEDGGREHFEWRFNGPGFW